MVSINEYDVIWRKTERHFYFFPFLLFTLILCTVSVLSM